MTEDYNSRSSYDSKESSSDVPQLRSQSLPRETLSTLYRTSFCFSPLFMRDTPSVQPVSTGAWEQQHLLSQTKATSTKQQWMSPDHHFRPLLPQPESFAHIPRSTLTLQTLTAQPSSITRLPPTPVFKQSPLSKETHGYHRSNADPSRNHESSLLWQETPVPTSGHLNRIKTSQQAPNLSPPNRWQQARDYRRKVYEPPYIDPETDSTIAYVEANAEAWVDQLIHAMSNTKDVKDTATSHHRRLFLSDSIDPLLIEACCREIFTALIDHCKNGFRGPGHFNKALKASHQLEPDRTAICEERISNVVKVLSWNKRACKDVLYEDWKIRLLVNHPLSYDKEKDSQKGSNDQRRRRQLAEREKMEKTEEELRAYREASGLVLMEDKGATQLGGISACAAPTQPGWLHDKDNSMFQDLGSSLGKRPTFDESEGSNSKRQRV